MYESSPVIVKLFQYWPWSAWVRISAMRGAILGLIRTLLLAPLAVIYGIWCTKEIRKYIYKPVEGKSTEGNVQAPSGLDLSLPAVLSGADSESDDSF